MQDIKIKPFLYVRMLCENIYNINTIYPFPVCLTFIRTVHLQYGRSPKANYPGLPCDEE